MELTVILPQYCKQFFEFPHWNPQKYEKYRTVVQGLTRKVFQFNQMLLFRLGNGHFIGKEAPKRTPIYCFWNKTPDIRQWGIKRKVTWQKRLAKGLLDKTLLKKRAQQRVIRQKQPDNTPITTFDAA